MGYKIENIIWSEMRCGEREGINPEKGKGTEEEEEETHSIEGFHKRKGKGSEWKLGGKRMIEPTSDPLACHVPDKKHAFRLAPHEISWTSKTTAMSIDNH